jgi:hypothetical protein
VLASKRPGENVGRLTAEQAEIARLTRENARMSKAGLAGSGPTQAAR